MKYIIWIATFWVLGQGYIKAIDRFDYHSVRKQTAVAMPEIYELNIGHAIIARAAIDGLEKAVRDMKRLMIEARL